MPLGENRSVLVLHNPTNRILTLEMNAPELESFRHLSGFIGSGFVTLEGGVLTMEAQTSAVLVP